MRRCSVHASKTETREAQPLGTRQGDEGPLASMCWAPMCVNSASRVRLLPTYKPPGYTLKLRK